MKRLVAGGGVLATLLLVGCAPQTSELRASNPEKYDKDDAYCRSQVDAETRRQRTIDSSNRSVAREEQDRFGQAGLPDAMDDYTAARSTDRMVSDCMEQRGWPVQHAQWWQRFGR